MSRLAQGHEFARFEALMASILAIPVPTSTSLTRMDARLLGFLRDDYLGFAAQVMAADISVQRGSVMIQGLIQKGDAKIIQFVRKPENYVQFARAVFLDSSGGDLPEAIQIPHLLATSHASTLVLRGSRCHSAC